jgi:hypothetical protein
VLAKPVCFPCVLKQALSATNLVTKDDAKIMAVLAEAAKVLATTNVNRSPGEVSFDCLRRTYEILGVADPFAAQKREQNERMLAHYEQFARLARESADRLKTAMKLAVAANIIDTGIGPVYDFDAALRSVLEREFAVDDSPEFRARLAKARTLLYVLDNAGEVVLDRLLIEQLKGVEVTCVVRRSPIINDVTAEDARQAGIAGVARMVDPGVDALGLPLGKCSPEFWKIFRDADLVVSKGQANFETLDESARDGRFGGKVFYLMLAKCACVAEELGVKVGDAIFKQA